MFVACRVLGFIDFVSLAVGCYGDLGFQDCKRWRKKRNSSEISQVHKSQTQARLG